MEIAEILTRGVANIIPNKETLEKSLKERKLTIYLGIDATATRIHLGHAVPLRKLQKLAEMGHHVIFLIGDFTALIGDTSDKDTERPILTSEQIRENFKTYKKQAEKILDFSKITVVTNSEWLGKLTFTDIVQLTQHFAVGDFVGRELIRRRLNDHKRVGLHEVLYPVMQGYDSYHLDADLQIGGTDQIFNMQAGRTLNKDLRNKDSFILTTSFLEGTDGRKMSKSWGNAIWLDDEPVVMYRKIMGITDDLIEQYFLLATDATAEEIESVKKRLEAQEHPMSIKKELAHRIVSEVHSKKDADDSADYFQKTVQEHQLPQDIPSFTWEREGSLVDFLIDAELAESKSEAKKLIEQGGVKIDGAPVEGQPNNPILFQNGQVVSVGKKRYIRIVV